MIVGMAVIVIMVVVMNRKRHVAVGVNMFMHMWAGMAAPQVVHMVFLPFHLKSAECSSAAKAAGRLSAVLFS